MTVAARWLEEPSPWSWPPERARGAQGARADAADAASGGGGDDCTSGVEAPFGPRFPAGAKLHWVRPSMLAAAAVTRQGTLEVRLAHSQRVYDRVRI